LRILHCSDVHVTHDYGALPWRRLGWRRWLALLELHVGGRARAYAGAAQRLRAIAEDVARHGADHLVLSGDLTAYALEEEFAAAREALGALAEDPARCTVVPGNHDTFTPGSVRWRRFERHFGHLLGCDLAEPESEPRYPFVRLLGEAAAVVGLCSARVPPFPSLAFGALGRRQLAALREIVTDARLSGRAVLVVVHHAPLRPGGGRDGRTHGLWDADSLLDALPGPRFAVLHGHVHRRYHHPATAARPHLFGAGSSTLLGDEGYWLIEIEDGVVRGGRASRPGEPGWEPAAAGSPAVQRGPRLHSK
jgi:3',5'-cyclic AMP phosphodiesterase CpdA